MEYKMFKLLVDSIPQPIWVKDLELRFIYINKAYEDIYDVRNKEIMGLKEEDIFDVTINKELYKSCNLVINSLKPITQEEWLNGKCEKVTIVPLTNENGQITAIAGIHANSDILNEKDKIIEEKEDILKVVIETLPGMVFCKDKEGKYIYANKAFNEFYNKRGMKKVSGKTNFDIHHSGELAVKYTNEDNQVIQTKRGIKAETILIDAESGKEIYTEAIKVPIIDRNNEVVGIVGLIVDITEKKEAEKKLKQLSFTDNLTELYNRTYFEEKIKELFSEENLPIGVIMGDANGLKLVNDTLGHSQGDELLKLIAQVLRDVCNNGEFIFRTGGDEYVILIPNTTDYECENIIKRIFKQCKNYRHDLIDVSISLGTSITDNLNKSIYDALKEAEDKVYRQKLLQRSSFNNSVMYSLQEGLENKRLETEEHIEQVVNYSLIIGHSLSLPIDVMDELTIVAKFHDIGKIGISEDILMKAGYLTKDEFEVVKTHTEKGYRIIKASSQLDTVAKGVLGHHERWDGTGYPLKLKGESIPLIARIVSIADAYDTMINNKVYKKPLNKEEAIEELQKCSGKQFDPDIVRVFVRYLKEVN